MSNLTCESFYPKYNKYIRAMFICSAVEADIQQSKIQNY